MLRGARLKRKTHQELELVLLMEARRKENFSEDLAMVLLRQVMEKVLYNKVGQLMLHQLMMRLSREIISKCQHRTFSRDPKIHLRGIEVGKGHYSNSDI